MLRAIGLPGLLSLAVGAAGCLLPCGGMVSPGYANTNDAGVVVFGEVQVGGASTLDVPIQDSANTNESLTGATFSGPDAAAFKVLSTFPMPMAAGTAVKLDIEFSPTRTGTSSATLTLETAAMGPSPVAFEGTGI